MAQNVTAGKATEARGTGRLLQQKSLHCPTALSFCVRAHRECIPLRAFLEKEVSRGQWEPSASRGGTGRRCTCDAPPTSDLGSQPVGSEATVLSHSGAYILSAPTLPCVQPQVQTCYRESLKRSPPLCWHKPRGSRPHSQDAPSRPLRMGPRPSCPKPPASTPCD